MARAMVFRNPQMAQNILGRQLRGISEVLSMQNHVEVNTIRNATSILNTVQEQFFFIGAVNLFLTEFLGRSLTWNESNLGQLALASKELSHKITHLENLSSISYFIDKDEFKKPMRITLLSLCHKNDLSTRRVYSPSIIVSGTPEEAAENAALAAAPIIDHNPKSSYGFAPGSTQIPFLKALVKLNPDLSQSNIFSLNEYYGMLPTFYSYSVYDFLYQNLIKPLDLNIDNFQYLDCQTSTPNWTTREYNTLLHDNRRRFQVLGIGPDADIGLNFPFSAYDSESRLVALSKENKESSKAKFNNNLDHVPFWAMTMGSGNIINPKQTDEIFLLSFKHPEAFAKAMWGPITEENPASLLRLHPKVTAFIDNQLYREAMAYTGRQLMFSTDWKKITVLKKKK